MVNLWKCSFTKTESTITNQLCDLTIPPQFVILPALEQDCALQWCMPDAILYCMEPRSTAQLWLWHLAYCNYPLPVDRNVWKHKHKLYYSP